MRKLIEKLRKIDFGDVVIKAIEIAYKVIVWAVIIMICAFAFCFAVGVVVWACWWLVELFAIGLEFALNIMGFEW